MFDHHSFIQIGCRDGDPPLIFSSSKFIDNENKSGYICVIWSKVKISDSEDVYPKPDKIVSF